MKKATYKRKLREQKILGVCLFALGTIGSVLVANWFIAMVLFPLAALLVITNKIVIA